MPAELVLERLAKIWVYVGDLRGCLIERIDQALVHLFGAGLVDCEAKLHQEALKCLHHCVQNVVKAIASADIDHIGEHLPHDPDDVLEVLVPLLAALEVFLRFDCI